MALTILRNTAIAVLLALTLAASAVLSAFAEDGGSGQPRTHTGGRVVEVGCRDAAAYPIHTGEIYHLVSKGDKKRIQYRLLEDGGQIDVRLKACAKGKHGTWKPFLVANCYHRIVVTGDTKTSLQVEVHKYPVARC